MCIRDRCSGCDRQAYGVRDCDFPRRQVLVVDVPPVSSVPADPTVAQLLKLLAERDRLLAERDQLLAERDRVQAEQAELIAALTGRLAELETRLGKNSQNSSQPRARMHSSSRRRGRCAASPAASRARARAASSESRSLRSMPRRRTYRHPTRISYRASPVTVRSCLLYTSDAADDLL